MALKVKAVGHRVIIKPDPVETKTKSGIVVAVDEKREAAAVQRGTVFDIGHMAWKNPLYGYGQEGWEPWCKVGDRVFYARYMGKMFKDNDGQFYTIMNDEDVQCLILDEGIDPQTDDADAA